MPEIDLNLTEHVNITIGETTKECDIVEIALMIDGVRAGQDDSDSVANATEVLEATRKWIADNLGEESTTSQAANLINAVEHLYAAWKKKREVWLESLSGTDAIPGDSQTVSAQS